MGDAGGHFAERGEIFLPANLLLQRGQFGEVAHQAQRAVRFARSACASALRAPAESRNFAPSASSAAVNRRYRHAQAADFAVGRDVLDFAALKRFSFAQASGRAYARGRNPPRRTSL